MGADPKGGASFSRGFTWGAPTTDFSTYAGRYRDLDYSFAAGRVRAQESRLFDGVGTARLLEARDIPEFGRLAAEAGIRIGEDPEKALSEHFAQSSAQLRDLCRETKYLDLFHLESDVHNLKLFLKHLTVFWPDPSTSVSDPSPAGAASATNADTVLPPTSREASLASIAGPIASPSTIAPEFLFAAVRDRNPDGIPRWLWQAASDAYASYAHTGEAYRIDTVLDRACAEQGVAIADELGNAWFSSLIRLRIDLKDLASLLRARTIGFHRDALAESLLGCGTLRPDDLLALYEQDDDALSAFFAGTPFGPLLQGFLPDGAEGEPAGRVSFGKASDDFLMAAVRSAKRISFGPEVLVAHRFAKETEIQNLRIVLTFLRSGIPVEEAQPLLRETYV